MYQILVSCLLASLVLVAHSKPTHRLIEDNPIVETDGGSVQGFTVSPELISSYYAFKGIPYAAAPVGNLRFTDPIPHAGWAGVRDASEHGNNCPQTGTVAEPLQGDEDCLFLNVYTPSLIGTRAVMVWIHGGSFSGQSGDAALHGADHLVQDDVVVVTINYRLGALGFLSTGDRHAPGNYGMKDMQLALKWVQRNIMVFGGDPTSVTVFGESAGGVAVHLLVLSPLSEGLFHKAISQSGSALNPWAFQIDPRAWAFELANRLGITAESTEDLVAQLRTRPPLELVAANPGWLDLEIPRGFSPMAFVPCIDAADSTSPIFLPRHPRDMMEDGDFMHIPYITGNTDAESLFIVLESLLDPSAIDQLNANPYAMIPNSWNIARGSQESVDIANEFRDFYLNGEMLSAGNLLEWSKYTTDHHFGYGIDTTALLHSQNQDEDVFYYYFTFVGDLNIVKRTLQLTALPGAVHADDIPYLFEVEDDLIPDQPSSASLLTRRRMIRLWTNFATTGNPTAFQDNEINVEWLPVRANQEYLEIGDSLVPGTFANGARMQFWHDLRQRYVELESFK